MVQEFGTRHEGEPNHRGIILVISGPSGVGKDTIIDGIISQTQFEKLPAYTTRAKRPNEVDGIDYRFVSPEQFQDLLENYEFLDHITIDGNSYGTPISDFKGMILEGKRAIIHLAVKTGLELKRRIPETITVFIMPPSRSALIDRLTKRGMTEEEIKKRQEGSDPNDYALAIDCDFIVVNHDGQTDDSVHRIMDFVSKIGPKTPPSH